MSIIKPKFDNRKYIGGVLKNKIKYIVVQDINLDKAYVSVAVNVGTLDCPTNYDGLPHFLEHMLFLGSSKYPKENHYQERLTALGGTSNAFTAHRETCYFFNVFNEGLEEMIEIFSRFFIDPLFAIEALDREMNAVNEEHLKNINNDNWRYNQLIIDLSNIKIFGTGSLTTLKKKDIREKMIEFYNNYYVSDNISICIASNMSIDKSIEVLEKTFENIKYKQSKYKEIDIKSAIQVTNKDYHMVSINDTYILNYIYSIPNTIASKQYRTKEFELLSNILGDNSSRGLKFMLKNNGLIKDMSSSVEEIGYFECSFYLTEYGYNNMDKINSIMNGYMDSIMKLNIKEIALYFNELNRTIFNTTKNDIEGLTISLSTDHFYYEPKMILFGKHYIDNIKESEHYTSMYREYIRDDNRIRILVTKNKFDMNYITMREYNTLYGEIKLNNSSSADIEYNVDTNSKYISMEPKIIKNLDLYESPILVSEKYWYGGSSKFNEPIINITLQLNNNNYFNTPKKYILTSITSHIINFIIETILYKSQELLVLSCNPDSINSCLIFSTNIPNDMKIFDIYLDSIQGLLSNIHLYIDKLNKKYIEQLVLAQRKNLENITKMNPSDYLSYIVSINCYKTEYSHIELLKTLDSIRIEEIILYSKNIFDNSSLTTIIYGNIASYNLPKITKLNNLVYNCYMPFNNVNLLDNIYEVHPNKDEKSNCIMLYFYVGSFVPNDILLLELVIEIFQELFFNELRTKLQLGYLVSMHKLITKNIYGIQQKIQSSKSIEVCKKHINTFNYNIIPNTVNSMDNKMFEEYKNILSKKINEQDNMLSDIHDRYSREIITKKYLFNRRQIMTEQLKLITLEEFVQFVKIVINKNNCKYIVVRGHSN